MSERVLYFTPRKNSRENLLHKTIKGGETITKKPPISFTPQTPNCT